MYKPALLAILVAAGARADNSYDAPAMVITSLKLPQPDCSPLKPIAPDQAVLFGLTGTVRVEYTVDESGRVGSISLDKSTAHPVLGETVKRWLSECSYVAASRKGKPIALRVSQLYIFKQP